MNGLHHHFTLGRMVAMATKAIRRVSCLRLALMLAAGMVAWAVPSLADGFSQAAPLTHARFAHTATLLTSGKVLVAAGATATDILNSAELYDPATNHWVDTGPLTAPRLRHTATLLPSGTVLVTGGIYGLTTLASAELYDPATHTWSSAGSMSDARVGHTATLLPSGLVLVTGGSNGTSIVRTSDLYDPIHNTWSAGADQGNGRAYASATLMSSGSAGVLLMGGEDASQQPRGDGLFYELSIDNWVGPVGAFTVARKFHTATLLVSGKVLAAAGYDSSALASAELYDPATSVWSTAGSLATARWSHTATLLPSGKVLVVAGVDPADNALTSAELYDPVANSWTTTGSLATARAQHTATLLPSGKVLVTGGQGAAPNFADLASSELYALDPIFSNGFD
jgi:hypothetical protein